jgi:2-polyprenyl-3-methyl-5-hydroxy-6-metoxy-1,4-benzoquinol methylase
MNPEEYVKLDRLEKEHWFYSGKREIVRYWIDKLHPLSPSSLLVDCGAGTGQFAAEMQSHCRVLAVDDHEESLKIATSKLGPSSVKKGSCLALPLSDESADCLTAMDVLEHVQEDAQAIGEFARVLKPEAIAVITVPALKSLWSDWDVSLHHFRRYTRSSFLKLLEHPEFRIEHWNFVNVVALPAVYIARKLRAIAGSTQRAEDAIPPRRLNLALKAAFTGLACQSKIRFPLGVGLLAVIRKVPKK